VWRWIEGFIVYRVYFDILYMYIHHQTLTQIIIIIIKFVIIVISTVGY